MQTYYQILCVPLDADSDAIRMAYRKLARERHPDMGGGNEEQMVALNLAYETLKDPQARAAYDRTLVPAQPKKRRPPAPQGDPTLFLLNVFRPIDAGVRQALRRLHFALDELAYDLYDDRYVAPFEDAFRALGKLSDDAVKRLWASNWPECFNSPVNLYLQGLRHLDDALEDFDSFLQNYDSDLIVEGREFILVGTEILKEASSAMGANR